MNSGLNLINDVNKCVLEKGNIAFWWLGQSGYIIKIGKTIIYLDAFLTERADRCIPPLLKPEEITNADFIIGTHDHRDHIDRNVWHNISLSSENTKFVVPNILVENLSKDLKIPKDRFIGLDDGISFREEGIKITGIASAHEFLDRDKESGAYPYLGYIIEGNECSIYHSGDTCIYEGLHSKLKRWDKFDIMFIPINGRDAERYTRNCIGNMTYQEAVDLTGSINPRLVVPGHYEMFTNNSEDPSLFADYMKVKYPQIKYLIGKHGEEVKLSDFL